MEAIPAERVEGPAVVEDEAMGRGRIAVDAAVAGGGGGDDVELTRGQLQACGADLIAPAARCPRREAHAEARAVEEAADARDLLRGRREIGADVDVVGVRQIGARDVEGELEFAVDRERRVRLRLCVRAARQRRRGDDDQCATTDHSGASRSARRASSSIACR